MTYKIWGWYHPAGGHYVVRVRTLTEPLTEQLVAVYRRTIEEFMPEEFYMDPDPDSFTRLDLAEDDETVPAAERGYTYFEMHT